MGKDFELTVRLWNILSAEQHGKGHFSEENEARIDRGEAGTQPFLVSEAGWWRILKESQNLSLMPPG